MGKRKKPPEPHQGNRITSYFSSITSTIAEHNGGAGSGSSSVPPLASTSSGPLSNAKKRKSKGDSVNTGAIPQDDDFDDGDDIIPQPALPQPTRQNHACNKTSFFSVFRPTADKRSIYHARLLAYRDTMHLLARHATSFLRYHILKYHSTHGSFPAITEDHFHAILYLLNKLDAWNPKPGGKQDLAALKIALLPDIRAYLRLVGLTPPNLMHDQQPIRYLAASLNTNLTVNISEHFLKMLLRYINLRLGNAKPFMHSSHLLLLTKLFQMSKLTLEISKDKRKR